MEELNLVDGDNHSVDLDHHTNLDPHKKGSTLSDVILGGQDGLVNVLGVILGVAAATGDAYIVMVAGLAATFAESVSMGAVAYTSTVADAPPLIVTAPIVSPTAPPRSVSSSTVSGFRARPVSAAPMAVAGLKTAWSKNAKTGRNYLLN